MPSVDVHISIADWLVLFDGNVLSRWPKQVIEQWVDAARAYTSHSFNTSVIQSRSVLSSDSSSSLWVLIYKLFDVIFEKVDGF